MLYNTLFYFDGSSGEQRSVYTTIMRETEVQYRLRETEVSASTGKAMQMILESAPYQTVHGASSHVGKLWVNPLRFES